MSAAEEKLDRIYSSFSSLTPLERVRRLSALDVNVADEREEYLWLVNPERARDRVHAQMVRTREAMKSLPKKYDAAHDDLLACGIARQEHDSARKAALARLGRLRPATLYRLSILDIRCPTAGCLLARVFPLSAGGNPNRLFVYLERKPHRSGFVDWPWPKNEVAMKRLQLAPGTQRVWVSTCRDGIATIGRDLILNNAHAGGHRTITAGGTAAASGDLPAMRMGRVEWEPRR